MIAEELIELLPKIASEDSPIPVEDFSAISDMDSEELSAFMEVWQALSAGRKRELIQELGKQADEHIELNFELINRAGLRDEDQKVRQTAIANLWECKDADLISVYLESLREDPSHEVRVAAADALGRYVLLGELEEIPSDQHQAIEDALLAVMDTEAISLLRQSCIEALGYSSRTESEQVIEQAYEAEDPEIRKSAIVAMGRSYNQRWGQQVLDQMTSPYPLIRAEAARAAGELELTIAIDPLIDLLDDVHNRVQEAAVWSLGQIGGDRAEEAL
ncbi:MAG: HEAT repeat domain-containing protein, partial [Anaerolineales bacterium]